MKSYLHDKPSIFRDEALKHFLQLEEGRGLIKISPPWTWILLLIFCCALGTSLVLAILGHVDINARGRGIVRPDSGVRLLVSQSAGTVSDISVRSSQIVKAGSVIFRINAPQIQEQVLESERQMESVNGNFIQLIRAQDTAYNEQCQRIQRRIAQFQEQITSHKVSVKNLENRLNAKLTLRKENLVSAFEVDEDRELLLQAQRLLISAQQDSDAVKQERAALESIRQNDLWQRKQIIQNAETKREALDFVRGQTVVQAPEDGVVEALLVQPGQFVQPGQAVGKLIPQGSPLQVVSFLEEKDRAFVKAGDEVHLELDQLPYSEYGTLRAEVVRISDDLASPFEIREALGENQKMEIPTYRVELRITDARALANAKVKLRTGMLMNVRYTLRRQPLISIIMAPLQRWFR